MLILAIFLFLTCRNAYELERGSESMGVNLGPVVQSWVSANPGLKFNPLFSFCIFTAPFLPKL